MRFDRLLRRADEGTLQQLIGTDTVRILRHLDPQLTSAPKLRELVELRHPPASLLREPLRRAALLDLMPEEEAQKLCERLGIAVKESPYSALRNLRFARGSARESALFGHFGVTETLEDSEGEEATHRIIEPGYALFDHQRDVARRALGALAEPPRRALLHMPTGAGKTRTAQHIIAEYLREDRSGLAIWLAHSEELCNQAAEEFSRAWSAMGNRPLSLWRYWGDAELDMKGLRDGFVVAGVPKLYNLAKRNIAAMGALGSNSILVILDEAHKATAESYRLLLDVLSGPDKSAGLLGLTATPGRSWDDIAADRELAALYNNTRIPLRVPGYSNPVEYLIDQGFLARPRFLSLLSSGSFSLTDADLRQIQEGLDIPERILKRLAEDEQRTLAIVSRVEELIERHGRVLVFATTVGHCHVVAAVLHARGFEAYAVTSNTPHSERQWAIQRYQQGGSKPVILCNFGVLTTGFDAPQTSAAVIARPTSSLVLYSQMIGRAMRGPKAGGNTECEIVTVIDQALPGFGSMAEAFEHWNDAWTEG